MECKIIDTIEKLRLLSNDKSNRYLFNKIKEFSCGNIIIFSVFSTTSALPFTIEGEGMKVRNGIFDYYIGDIVINKKELDNKLIEFINQE